MSKADRGVQFDQITIGIHKMPVQRFHIENESDTIEMNAVTVIGSLLMCMMNRLRHGGKLVIGQNLAQLLVDFLLDLDVVLAVIAA